MKQLLDSLKFTAETCIDCGRCNSECLFLSDMGSPAAFALEGLSSDEALNRNAVKTYECSMCGLCSAVCPVDAEPAAMFGGLRFLAQERGLFDLKQYSPLLSYERTGRSFLFRGSIIPKGCTTAFFPGCTLPALFPRAVKNAFAALRQNDASFGLIFNCCSKPSKMLGLKERHETALSGLAAELRCRGIKRIVTSCPNCHVTLKEYGPDFEVSSIFEELLEKQIPTRPSYLQQITVHDPCVIRDEHSIHRAVRTLLTRSGADITEMKHCGSTTICCGEGGAVNFHKPANAQEWRNKRIAEARETGRPMVSYCAGCVNQLNSGHPTVHLLDLLMVERNQIPDLRGFPRNYINRLILKHTAGR
ncbi:(Fe-S)-binding protein [Maridesulfovibrio sp. FT414]|uniref:(Fe-S)-binding protein n=1 Tax=Maridesulfovibrio sp. FT414 TaxID=2979469 RepID=UPI003D80A3F5